MRLSFVLLTSVIITACEHAPSAAPITIADSAGVRILTIRSEPGDLPQWTVDSATRVKMASPDSAGLSRVSAAHWLADHRVLVVEPSRYALLLYDSSGAYLRSLGRRGSGPGEFRNMITVSVSNDTIGVWDLSQRRFSVLTPDNGFRQTLPMQAAPTMYDVTREAWILPGQSVLALWLLADAPTPLPQGVRIRRWQSSAKLTLNDTGGTVLAESAPFRGSYSGDFVGGDARQVFSNTPFVAVSGARIAWGSGERFEVFVADETLRTRSIVRWSLADELLTSDEVARAREAVAAGMPPGIPTERLAKVLDDVLAAELLPDVRPALSRALFDDAGQLWLGRFEVPVRGIAEAYRWVVLDSNGVPVARVELPDGVRLESVRGNDALVTVLDSLGVPTVQIRSLRR